MHICNQEWFPEPGHQLDSSLKRKNSKIRGMIHLLFRKPPWLDKCMWIFLWVNEEFFNQHFKTLFSCWTSFPNHYEDIIKISFKSHRIDQIPIINNNSKWNIGWIIIYFIKTRNIRFQQQWNPQISKNRGTTAVNCLRFKFSIVELPVIKQSDMI